MIKLEDNGVGIRTAEELDKHFATVGQPHEASEQKTYGEFRMGRGQMFAYGKNTWLTGPFKLVVDVKNAGLGYTEEPSEPRVGTSIEIELYEELPEWRVSSLCNELRDKLACMDLDLTINGEAVEKHPDEFWTHRMAEADLKLVDSNEYLAIYNMGMFVCNVSSSKYGVSGTISAKQKLKLNYARNEVQDDCPVWRHIETILKSVATRSVRVKSRLTDGEKSAARTRLAAGTLDFSDMVTKKILTLANGQSISMKELANAARAGTPVAFDEEGGAAADMAIRSGKAIVLSQGTLRDLGFSRHSLEEANDWFHSHLRTPIGIQKFEDLGLSDAREFIPPPKHSKTEKFWLRLVADTHSTLCYTGSPRSILLGKSDCFAWTDGATYIALTQGYLKGLPRNFKGLFSLGHTLAHEYCHLELSAGRHDHTFEFYHSFHDLVEARMDVFLKKAAQLLKQRSPEKGSTGLLNLIDS